MEIVQHGNFYIFSFKNHIENEFPMRTSEKVITQQISKIVGMEVNIGMVSRRIFSMQVFKIDWEIEEDNFFRFFGCFVMIIV